MDVQVSVEDEIRAGSGGYLLALRSLPDGCAPDLSEVARRIGADKLELIQWVRADIKLARLLASKLTT